MALLDVAGFLNWFLPFIQAYGPWSVFLGVLLEEIIVPIPSPLILLAAGSVIIPASATFEHALVQAFFIITIPGAIAMTIGSLVIYAVGYYGGDPLVKRFHKFLGTSVQELHKTSKNMQESKNVWFTIATLRVIFIVPTSLVSLAAGFLRLEWKRFALATFIGAIPRILILSLIGWQVGATFLTLAEKLGSLENIVFGTLVLGGLFLVYHVHKKKTKR